MITARALADLAARATTQVERDLVRALFLAHRRVPLGPLERAILTRNIEEAIRLIGLDAVGSALAGIRVRVDPVRGASWENALQGLPPEILAQRGVLISLDAFAALNADRVAALDRLDLSRIRGTIEETRRTIREAVTRSVLEGVPPREAARQIRDVVGLTGRQATSVLTFRARLVAEGRAPAQIERMTERFARRQLTIRATVIARTEVQTVLMDAKRLQWQRLVDEGQIDPAEWEQIWKTADDERVDCVLCAPFDERTAPIGGLFTPDPEKVKPGTPATSSGPILHPMCRCTAVLGRKGLRAFRLARGGSARRRVLAGLGR